MTRGPGVRAAGKRVWRSVLRVPLWCERRGWHGLARVFTRLTGVEWIVLETVGRRSGRPHVVVLDVVGGTASGDCYYVQPAEGRRSQWLRNALAHPDVVIRTRTGRRPARARDASGAEGAAVVLAFIRGHPRYARLIVRWVGYVHSIDVPDDVLRRQLAATPVIALEPAPSTGPTPRQ